MTNSTRRLDCFRLQRVVLLLPRLERDTYAVRSESFASQAFMHELVAVIYLVRSGNDPHRTQWLIEPLTPGSIGLSCRNEILANYGSYAVYEQMPISGVLTLVEEPVKYLAAYQEFRVTVP